MDGVGAGLARRLEQVGHEAVVVPLMAGDGITPLPETPDFEARIASLVLDAAARIDVPLMGAVHAWALDRDTCRGWPLERALRVVAGGALEVARGIAGVRRTEGALPRLWLVTHGAQNVATGDDPPDPVQATLWGLGRSFALEHPRAWGGLVDLGAGTGAEMDAALLFREVLSGDAEQQVALRGDARLAARLVRAEMPQTDGARFDPDASYLVTGGLGALGRQLARWLAERGARHLVVTSRRGSTDPEAEPLRSALAELGTETTILTADVSDQPQVAQLLDAIAVSGHRLRGVFHCAGILEDGVLLQMTWRRFESVLAAKLNGAWHLHLATRENQLDHLYCSRRCSASSAPPAKPTTRQGTRLWTDWRHIAGHWACRRSRFAGDRGLRRVWPRRPESGERLSGGPAASASSQWRPGCEHWTLWSAPRPTQSSR